VSHHVHAAHPAGRPHGHGHDHGHTHGLIDPSVSRSREGVRFVSLSLLVLLLTAGVQAVIFAGTGSIALFADLVHNGGDALTALPLGAAFLLRSWRAERWAGFLVVATILVSGIVCGVAAIERLLDPQDVGNLWVLAAAGAVGFAGNEVAAVIRLRGGRRLDSAALVADGHHARVDGLVSLSVILSAVLVSLGLQVGDPLVGFVMTIVILRITWQSFMTVLRAEAPHTHP
jgi:cation diffusion facilitator family transporter